MVALLTRSCLLFLTGTLAVSVGYGQPREGKDGPPKTPHDRPYYTAFPDLKPPTYERKVVKNPNGTKTETIEEKGGVPLPPLPALAADASPLRKVQYEQVQAGLSYLFRVKEQMLHQVSGPPLNYERLIQMTTKVYRAAVELEETPAKRVPWGEARVRALKEIEERLERRALNGIESPTAVDVARFERLQAEADLLMLKAEANKAKK